MELNAKQNQQLVKDIKAGKTQPECARNLGVTPGQLGMMQFCKAQVEAGIVSKAPATEASVKKLRTSGARWELIAAQTGLSIAKIKEFVGEGTYIGRGRKPADSKPSGRATAAARGGKAAPGKPNTRAGKTGVNPVAPARARTRAERAARSGNPS